jgi:uncharacterized protein (DUF4415 family)
MAGRKDDPFDEGRSLREEVAYARLVAELREMRRWWEQARVRPGVVPAGEAGSAVPPQGRSKLTLKLDAEVVKFFRAMGLGYQARMNHALRAWMLAMVDEERAAGAAGKG